MCERVKFIDQEILVGTAFHNFHLTCVRTGLLFYSENLLYKTVNQMQDCHFKMTSDQPSTQEPTNDSSNPSSFSPLIN